MRRFANVVPPSVLIVGAASLVSASSLVSVIRGPGLWVGAVLGVVVALAATAIWNRFELMLLEWVAVSLALFILLGGVVAGPVPGPTAYAAFLDGLINGWADLLSSVPPVAATGPFVALPYTLAYLAAMSGIALVRKVKISISGAIGPAIAFGIGLLFSVELRSIALLQGSLLVALSLALGWYQQRFLGFELDEEIGNTTVARRRSRFLFTGAALLLAAGLAPVLAPFTPGLDGRERFDLRDSLEPPWNPLDEPSPLAQIKSNYLDENREDVVFVVAAPEQDLIPRRWGLATLAAFDGSVWTVGDSELDGLAPFVPIDDRTPEPEFAHTVSRPEVEVSVEIVSLDGPWIPVPGRASSIQTGDSLGAGSVRFNGRTHTAALPSGVMGLSYSVTAEPSPIVDEAALAEATYLGAAELGLDQQSSAVRDWSADVVAGADFGWPQVAAIRDSLRAGGYLADEQVQPGHSWARLSDFFANEDFFGNEEQYAAVAAIAARNAGLQSRVVVGYLIDQAKLDQRSGEVAVTRTEASAWLEVFTEDFGWVAIDVTPDRDNEPSLQDEGFRTEAVATPNPPPTIPPPPEQEVAPEEEVDEEEEEDEEDQEEASGGILTVVLASAVALGGPLALAGGWILFVGGLKALRRRRRRNAPEPAEQVVGAWYEVRDRFHEFGIEAADNASLHEFAGYAESTSTAAVGVLELADIVDRSAFAPSGGGSEVSEAAWERSDALVSRVRRSRGRLDRVRSLASPGTLMKRGSR